MLVAIFKWIYLLLLWDYAYIYFLSISICLKKSAFFLSALSFHLAALSPLFAHHHRGHLSYFALKLKCPHFLSRWKAFTQLGQNKYIICIHMYSKAVKVNECLCEWHRILYPYHFARPLDTVRRGELIENSNILTNINTWIKCKSSRPLDYCWPSCCLSMSEAAFGLQGVISCIYMGPLAIWGLQD